VCGETGHASEWHKVKEWQGFVEAISTNPTQNVKDWLKWAKDKQAELDPLSNGTDVLIEGYLTLPTPPKYGYF